MAAVSEPDALMVRVGRNGTSRDDDAVGVTPSVHAPDEAEREPTEEEQQAHWQAVETDILAGFRQAAEREAVDVAVCEFPRIVLPKLRNGKPIIGRDGKPETVPLRTRHRAVHDDDIEACQRRATRMEKNRVIPHGPRQEVVNQSKFRSLLIYESTVPEDQAAVWNQRALWDLYGVGNGVELIEKALTVGEKMQAVMTIFGHSNMFMDANGNPVTEEDAVAFASGTPGES